MIDGDPEDPRLYLCASDIDGTGVFTNAPIKEGESILVRGHLIARDSFSDECTRHADCRKLRCGPDLLLYPTGFGNMVNHSETPNLEKKFFYPGLWLSALRDIKAGEELTIKYEVRPA